MKKKYIKMFIDNAVLVNRLCSLLKNEGINAVIKDNIESGRLAGFGTFNGTVELFVLQTDFEKANSVIAAFIQEINN